MNSNSSLPQSIQKLADSGLDSLRVSLNSAQKRYYDPYHRPINYNFEDVKRSIGIMKEADKFVSLNYFILPGVTDSFAEFDAFCELILQLSPDFIQLRNLNIDPEWYLKTINFSPNESAMGIRKWKAKLMLEFPALRLGYFNPPLK